MSVELMAVLVKGGALGFAFFVAWKSYLLIHDRRKGWGVYLPVTLLTSLVFLYVEFLRNPPPPPPVAAEIKVLRLPDLATDGVPRVTVHREGDEIEFQQGMQVVSCDKTPLLRVNSEALVEALKEERRKMNVAGSTGCQGQSGALGGFDLDAGAGGQP